MVLDRIKAFLILKIIGTERSHGGIVASDLDVVAVHLQPCLHSNSLYLVGTLGQKENYIYEEMNGKVYQIEQLLNPPGSCTQAA